MDKLFAPSLLRALVSRNVLVSVLALVVVVAVAIYESNQLILSQFADESGILADVALNEITDQQILAQNAASLVASLPTTRELTELGDADGLTTFLLVVKARIGVGDMSVADNNGGIIASAQERTSDTFQPELVTLAQAGVQQSWVLFDEPQGLVIRAIYVIRNANQDPIGMMEAGNVLGSEFLKSIKTRSDADLALIWNGQVRASTVDFGPNPQFPSIAEVDAQAGDVLIQNVTANNKNYYGIFRVLRSSRQNPGLLAVLVPTAGVDQAQRTLLAVLVLLGIGLVGIVTLLAYRTARGITVPLRNLPNAAQRIEAADVANGSGDGGDARSARSRPFRGRCRPHPPLRRFGGRAAFRRARTALGPRPHDRPALRVLPRSARAHRHPGASAAHHRSTRLGRERERRSRW